MTEFWHDARRINHRLGEGSSPRLRQIREGLDAMGIQSDHILHHATPRIIYGCELVPQARAHLLGLAPDPTHKSASIDAIARGWRRRWLAKRILRDETLERLRSLGRASVYALFHADGDGQLFPPLGD